MLLGALGSCTLALAVLAGAAPEVEHEPAAVVIAPAVFDGAIDARDREQMEQALHEGIRRAGARLVEDEGVEPCAEERCLGRARERARATHALGLRVELQSRDYGIRLVLVDALGRSSTVDAACEICGIDEAVRVVGEQVATLERKLATEVSAQVVVESQPPGAQVFLDGEPIGTTPLAVPIRPGEHRLRLQLEGHIVVEDDFVAVSGARDTMSFGLASIPPSPAPAPAPAPAPTGRGKWIAGWVLLGTGAAGLVGGGVFWGYHHQDVLMRCDDPVNLDINGTCRYRYDAFAPGLGLTLAGAAASLAGATLVVLGRNREPSRRSLRAMFSPRSVGLQGRF